jgi:hypothetical protein
MAAFSLTCSPIDQVAILGEINALRQKGTEVCRVIAVLAQLAADGQKVMNQNHHTQVSGRDLHSICPYGTIGAYYAYDSNAQSLYMLGYFENHLRHFADAAARLSNVP